MGDGSSKAWFRSTRWGTGSGLPITWQGWATYAAFMAAIVPTVVYAKEHIRLIATASELAVYLTITVLKTDWPSR